MPASTETPTFDLTMTVNEIIQRWPQTGTAFNTLGIDSCCGGAHALGDVVTRHKLDLNDVLDTLRRAVTER
ncbi:MAG TPA: DUF542 domain-containing protein [Gemmatimonadaceae bacterium]|jgi:iron-sulfur cluster repair protein YtfE (RIC family)|nr:DUF542 domain-containing protein [Gemmatimonadaceae bacterium]